MIIILEEQTGVVELAEQVAMVYEVADFNVPSGINESIFTAAGQLIVALSASTPTVIDEPNADGLVLTSDPTDPKKIVWRAVPSGGGGGQLTNKRGSSVSTGNVVILSNDYDSAFTTSSTANDARVIGVAAEDISNNALGQVLSMGKGTALVQGNVARGEWLVNSATDGRAKAAGYAKPLTGAIGIALEAYSGGGAGSVAAWIMTQPYLGASKGRGYILGGYTTTYINNGQILTYANATTALVVGTNLSVSRRGLAGVSGVNAGYAMGGYTGSYVATTDKVTYASDTTTATAVANLSAARQLAAGVSGVSAGYAMGGALGGYSAVTDKVTYASDTTTATAGANLSAARQGAAGVSGVSAGYAMGGYTGSYVATTDKVTYASDTTAATAGANLSVGRQLAAGVSGVSAGYAMGGTTGSYVATTDKVTYASDTTAATAGANLSAARMGAAGLGGSITGYAVGGNNGSASAVADAVSFSTDTTAAAASANLPTASSEQANVFASV